MATLRDIATFTVKSLGLHQATPTTDKDWEIIGKIITEKLSGDNKQHECDKVWN